MYKKPVFVCWILALDEFKGQIRIVQAVHSHSVAHPARDREALILLYPVNLCASKC